MDVVVEARPEPRIPEHSAAPGGGGGGGGGAPSRLEATQGASALKAHSLL